MKTAIALILCVMVLPLFFLNGSKKQQAHKSNFTQLHNLKLQTVNPTSQSDDEVLFKVKEADSEEREKEREHYRNEFDLLFGEDEQEADDEHEEYQEIRKCRLVNTKSGPKMKCSYETISDDTEM